MPDGPIHPSDGPGAPLQGGPPQAHLARATFVFEVDHAIPAGHGVVGRVVRGTTMPGDRLLLYAEDGSASPVEAQRAERLAEGDQPRDAIWALHLRVPVHRYGPLGGASPRLEVSTGQLLLGFAEGQAPLRQVASKELADLLEARGIEPLAEDEMDAVLDLVAEAREDAAMARVSHCRPDVPDPDLLSVVRRMRRILRPDAGKGAGQCFIATAACGAADAPDVLALQRFRDRVLMPTRTGRRIAGAYLRLSPPLADWVAGGPLRRAVVLALVVRPGAWLARRLTARAARPER